MRAMLDTTYLTYLIYFLFILLVIVALFGLTELVQFLLGRAAPSAPSRVIVVPKFVPDLAARSPPPKLPPVLEPGIKINPNESLVQLHPIQQLLGLQRLPPRLKLDKAESAGSLAMAIEPHDDAPDGPALGKELVDLLLGGVEGQVSDVEGARLGHIMNEHIDSTLEGYKRAF